MADGELERNRQRTRLNMRRLRQFRRALGLCYACGLEPANGFKACADCRFVARVKDHRPRKRAMPCFGLSPLASGC